ncbi:MAG: NeuD/PglB/VioB family sugar acetyltransferase [Myxococcales bacterium]|nr:NeuD/PglB/VioB family sugar acetyltransferase [Myxococcales bacterium]
MIRYAVYGSAGCGRGVMPLIREQVALRDGDADFVFVDDDPSRQGGEVNGVRCIPFGELISADLTSTRICVAVAEPNVRRALVEKCQAAGLEFFEVAAADHVRYDEVEIASGAIFCASTMVTANVRIGAHFHCNIYSYVEHDCLIGDFVTFAPRVSCNGNIIIEDGAYVGTGAVLKQGTPGRPLRVGKGAVVGMGAVVVRDVAPGSTVVGNPAQPLESQGYKEG